MLDPHECVNGVYDDHDGIMHACSEPATGFLRSRVFLPKTLLVGLVSSAAGAIAGPFDSKCGEIAIDDGSEQCRLYD